LVGGCFQDGYGDEAEAFAVGCCEDLWEGADGSLWVGDAVVEGDDGAGGEILFYEPADVPDGRV
jgi:hypothetical protein